MKMDLFTETKTVIAIIYGTYSLSVPEDFYQSTDSDEQALLTECGQFVHNLLIKAENYQLELESALPKFVQDKKDLIERTIKTNKKY